MSAAPSSAPMRLGPAYMARRFPRTALDGLPPTAAGVAIDVGVLEQWEASPSPALLPAAAKTQLIARIRRLEGRIFAEAGTRNTSVAELLEDAAFCAEIDDSLAQPALVLQPLTPAEEETLRVLRLARDQLIERRREREFQAALVALEAAKNASEHRVEDHFSAGPLAIVAAEAAAHAAAAALAAASAGVFGVGREAAAIPVEVVLDEMFAVYLQQTARQHARAADGLSRYRRKWLAENKAFFDVLLRWIIEHKGSEPQQQQGADGRVVFSLLAGVAWTQHLLARYLSRAREPVNFLTMVSRLKAYADERLGTGWQVGPGMGRGSREERHAFVDVFLRWIITHKGDEPLMDQGPAGDVVFCLLAGVAWTQQKLAYNMKSWRKPARFLTMDPRLKAYADERLGAGWQVGPGTGAGSREERSAFVDVFLRWIITHKGDEPKRDQGPAGDIVFCLLTGVAWTQQKLAINMTSWRTPARILTMDPRLKAYADERLGTGWQVRPTKTKKTK
jgi:hypothetical protein